MDDQGVNYRDGYAKGWGDAVAIMRVRIRQLNSPREDLSYYAGWNACRFEVTDLLDHI